MNMQQEMEAMYLNLEASMKKIQSYFPKPLKKFNMGENILLMDFSPKDFDAAKKSINDIPAEESADIRINIYEEKKRISIIF